MAGTAWGPHTRCTSPRPDPGRNVEPGNRIRRDQRHRGAPRARLPGRGHRHPSSAAGTAKATPPSTPSAASTSTIAEGELTAVMGPSGSGKSTLMHLLAGLDRPTAGTVTIDGTEITRLNDTELTKLRRSHIGFVFQFFNLLPMLTRRGERPPPALDRRREAGQRLDRGARSAASASRDRRKHRPAELSGGQQQRVADRPRAGLAAGRRLRRRADRQPRLAAPAPRSSSCSARRSPTTARRLVMVTHDVRAATIADRILFLADGRIRKDARRALPPRRSLAALEEVTLAVTSVALKGLAGRKLRAFLTALAIVLGVAMVSGTYVLTDTIKSRVRPDLQPARTRTPPQWSPASRLVSFAQSGGADRAGVVLAGCGRCPTSQTATGADLQPRRQLRPGEADRPRRQAARLERQPDLRLRLRPRRRAVQPDAPHRTAAGPHGPHEIVIDAASAEARATSRSATRSASSIDGPDRAVPDRRHREVRLGRLARRRDDRRLRHRRRRSGCSASRATTRSPSRRRTASRPSSSCARSSRSCRRPPGADRGGAGRRERRRTSRSSSNFIQLLPARVRRRSPCSSARSSSSTRSRSRSPSGPASWRRCARSAPRAGRCGARCCVEALRDRRRSRRRSASRSGRRWRRGSSALMARSGLDLPKAGHGVRDRARSSSRSCVGIARHGRRQHRAGAPGDAGPADRGRARGRDAAAGPALALVPHGRRRSSVVALSRRCSATGCSPTGSPRRRGSFRCASACSRCSSASRLAPRS